MTTTKPSATDKPVSSLSGLHNLQAAKGSGSKNDVSGSTAAPAVSQAGVTSDLSLHGGDKKTASDDFADAISFRVSGMEKNFGSLVSKVDGLAALLSQLVTAHQHQPQQQQQQGAAAATPAAEVKIDHGISASGAALTKDQEARLAAVKDLAFGSNASILGATLEQKKAILAAIDSKVSAASGAFAGLAGPSSATLQQLQLDHQQAVRRQEEALQAKITTLGKAKSYPELNERIMKKLVENATDKHYVTFTIAHATIVARYNDKRGFAAASFYHYEMMDKVAQLDDDDRRTFFQVNLGGNADLIGQVNDRFNPRKEQQGNNGNNHRGGRGRGNNNNNNDGSFRGGGRGRGAGRGSTEGTSSVTSDKKPGVV